MIMKLNTAFLLKGASFRITSAAIPSTPITLTTKRQVAIAAMGIITELVRKSKKSRKGIFFKMVTKDKGP